MQNMQNYIKQQGILRQIFVLSQQIIAQLSESCEYNENYKDNRLFGMKLIIALTDIHDKINGI